MQKALIIKSLSKALSTIYRQVGVEQYEQIFEMGTDSQAQEAVVDEGLKFSVYSMPEGANIFRPDKTPRKVISMS